MRLNKNFVIHEIEGSEILLPIGTGGAFNGMIHLNGTAAFILNQLMQDTTEEAIVQALLSAYRVDPKTAAADVQTILQNLRRLHALDE